MTTSTGLARFTLQELSGMFLGLWEAGRLRNCGNKGESDSKLLRIERGIGELKGGFGLQSIRDFCRYDTSEDIGSMEQAILNLRSGNYSYPALVETCKTRGEKIRTLLMPFNRALYGSA